MIDNGHTCTSMKPASTIYEQLCKGTHTSRPPSHEWNWPTHGYCERSCWEAGFAFEGSNCGS